MCIVQCNISEPATNELKVFQRFHAFLGGANEDEIANVGENGVGYACNTVVEDSAVSFGLESSIDGQSRFIEFRHKFHSSAFFS